eukprot:jgi/Mesen1/10580/ME000085S09917
MFERLQSNGNTASLLGVQYRMHPDISSWPNAQFYQGKLEDGPNVKRGDYRLPDYEEFFGPYRVFDVFEGSEEEGPTGIS